MSNKDFIRKIQKDEKSVAGIFNFFCPSDDDDEEIKERGTMPKIEKKQVYSPINFSKFKDSKYRNSHFIEINYLIEKNAEKFCLNPEDNVSLETLIELLYVKFYGKRIAAYTRSIGDTELRLILARNLAIVGKGGEGSRIYEETRRSTKHVSDVLRNVRGVWNWYDSESEFAQRRNCRRRRDIEGDESHIYEIHSGDYFYKLIDGLSPNSDNLSYTTNRIISHNLLFGERTKFEFDGFALVDGKIRVVVKQKVIKPDFVSKDILENYVKDYFERHFTSDRYNLFGQSFLAFENDIFSISDLRQANVFVCDRKCYVIDCVIKLKDTSFFEKFDGVDRTDPLVYPLSGWWDGSPNPDPLVSFGDDYYNNYYNVHTRKSLSPHSWSIPNGARLNDNLVVETGTYKDFPFYTVGIKDDSERTLYCIPKDGQDPHSPDYDFSGDWVSDWDEMLYDHFDAIVEKREKETKKRELSNKYHGYLSNKTALSAGKIDEYLSQLQRSNKDGSVVTRAQNIEYLVTLGIPQKREFQNYNPKKDKYVPYNYYGLYISDTESYELTKSQYDYAVYLYDLKNTSLKSLQEKVKSLKNINMGKKHSNNMPLGNYEKALMDEIRYYDDTATIPDIPFDGLGTLWGSVSDSDMYLDVSEWAHTTDIPAFALQLLNEVETILDSELHADTVVTGGVDKRRKIDDYGEKIYGARKDMLKEIAKSYDSLTKQVLISKTFSQVFKQPDVKTLLDSGVIRNSDAQFIYAVCQTMQTKPRGSSWTQKQAIEKWANRTMDKIVLIKSVLLATTDEERDNIIKAATTVTEEDKALRVSVIQKLRELNKHLDEDRLKDFGAVESIKEMKIFDQVLTEINYTVGDKTEIPIKRIVPARTYDRYVLIDASNTEVMSAYSEKDAIDKIVSATFIANPYEGMQLPIKQMKICPDRNSAIKLPTGLWDYKAIECYPNSNLDRIYTIQDSDLFNNLKSWGDWLYSQDVDDSYMTETQAKKAFAEYKERYPRKKNVALCRMHERQNITGYSKYQIGVNDSKGVFKYITVDADSKDNAIAALEINYDSWNEQIVALLLEGKSKKASTFEDKFEVLDMTYSYRSRNNKERPFCVIYKPYVFKGCINRARVADFETKEAAKSWIKNEGQNFLKRLAERRKLEEPFFNRSGQRKGHDYRNGKDINEKTLAEKFGFRGIQFGNWTNDRDRQAAVNNCYDALLDMCEILNLNPKAISLNGTLGMAFGARGSGSFNAHYEPMETVINLTKTRGAGSLAHEWWHALDNHWSSTHHLYLTSDYIDGVRPQVSDAYKLLSKAIKESEYGKRCMSISGSYWGSMIEMTARLFQVYIDYKLREKENTSPFLERGFYEEQEKKYLEFNYETYQLNQKIAGNKDVMSIEDFAKTDQALTGYVYTSQEDLKMFIPLIDNIFKTIHQTITENGNVKLSGIRRKRAWR